MPAVLPEAPAAFLQQRLPPVGNTLTLQDRAQYAVNCNPSRLETLGFLCFMLQCASLVGLLMRLSNAENMLNCKVLLNL